MRSLNVVLRSLSACCLTACWLAACCLAGCGNDLGASVSGVVSYDGVPLHTGNIAFSPTGPGTPASGTIREDGSYAIRTASREGLAPGEYQVTVTSFKITPGDPPMPGQSHIPRSYNRPETANLKFTVAPGANAIDIKLEKRPG